MRSSGASSSHPPLWIAHHVNRRNSTDLSMIVGVSALPFITLVHSQSDVQAVTGTRTAASTSNAAGRIALGSSVWNWFRATPYGHMLGLPIAAMG